MRNIGVLVCGVALLSTVSGANYDASFQLAAIKSNQSTLIKTSFAGNVQAISLSSNSLRVADMDGNIVQVTLGSDTEILRDHKPVSLTELRVNDPVVVRYWIDSQIQPLQH